MNGLTDDMKRFLLAQTLMGAAQPMLAASAPSTDPRNKSFGYALSQGIGGMQQGQQQGMAGIMARMQMEDAMRRRAAREQLAGQIGQPPQQGIASMMGGGTMLDSGQVLPQGQTMMGNRVVPQGLADIMKAGIGSGELGMADAMKLYTQEPKKFGSASAGAAIYDETTGEVKNLVPAKSEIKEINLPPVIDLFLTQRFGSSYTSAKPEDRRKYLDYMATDEGRKDFETAAPKLVQLMATPFYQVVPTSEGLMQFNARQPGVSVDTGKNKPLTGEMVTTEQQFGTLQDGFNQVKSTYKKDYVGPVSGRIGSAKEKTVGIPDEQAAFYSALEGMKNQLIYALSGKQINESEYNRLLKQLPDRNLPDKVFESRMKEFERTLNSIISGRHKAMGGYGIPSGQPKGGSKFEIIGVE